MKTKVVRHVPRILKNHTIPCQTQKLRVQPLISTELREQYPPTVRYASLNIIIYFIKDPILHVEERIETKIIESFDSLIRI